MPEQQKMKVTINNEIKIISICDLIVCLSSPTNKQGKLIIEKVKYLFNKVTFNENQTMVFETDKEIIKIENLTTPN